MGAPSPSEPGLVGRAPKSTWLQGTMPEYSYPKWNGSRNFSWKQGKTLVAEVRHREGSGTSRGCLLKGGLIGAAVAWVSAGQLTQMYILIY